jgi:O-antigen/teichoic acid export membrane protein
MSRDVRPEEPAAPKASSAGRGVLYIAFAKFYFMAIGLAIQVGLPRILSRATFGAFGVVNSIVSPINNVMVTGSIQAVSRFTAQSPERVRLVQHAGLRMQVFFGLPVALLYMAASPLIASLLHDRSKTLPLLVSGLVVVGYAFYAVFVGTANGTRQFHKQAGLDITFATLRMVGILGMAIAGLGVTGVVGGWVIAVGVILTVAVTWVGLPRLPAGSERLPVRPMIEFFVGVAVYLILFNCLMFVDTWLVKRLMTQHYVAEAGRLATAVDEVLPWARQVTGFHYDPSQLADVQVAYYTAAQNLARLSYQAIIAATFVIFPLVSRSTFEDDRETTRRYVQITMRYSLIFAMTIAIVMAAIPEPLLAVVYPRDYAHLGAPALAALALGNVAFSLFAIAGTILNGAGRTIPAIAAALITLVLSFAGNYVVLPRCEPGLEALLAAGTVTGVSMLIGAAISSWAMWKELGAVLPLLSLVRVVVASAAAIAVGRVLPVGGPVLTLGAAVLVAIVFLAMLVVTRELGRKDLSAIAAVRRKRAPGGET